MKSLAALSLLVASVAQAATFNHRPFTQSVTQTQVVLKWSQSSGGATITYGPKGGQMATRMEPASNNGDHEVTLAGLVNSTRYAFAVDAGGGNVAAGEFTTAVLPAEPFSFIVYGDNRTNDADHATVVKAMVAEGVDFLVNTGDVVEWPLPGEYDNFFKIEAPLLSQNVLFTSFGNHEFSIGAGTNLWLGNFANPTASSGTERYYTFDYGNSRFVVLDFNASTQAQTTWLGATLADARMKGFEHLFAVMHHSPYDSGNHGENTTAQKDWVPHFQQHQLDLILGGHDHDYERGWSAQTSLRYIVTGGGGAPLYNANSKKPYQQKFASLLHYVKISVNGTVVTVVAKDPAGNVIDMLTWDTAKPQPDGGVADMANNAGDLAQAGDGAVVGQPDQGMGGGDGGGKPADLGMNGGRSDLAQGGGEDMSGQPPLSQGCGCVVGGRRDMPPLGLAIAGLVIGFRILRRRRG